MNRFVCIHGHFYQPPRENPWLEEIELQESAYPYVNWNERISAECYAPNTASRILDQSENILEIVNNYSRISFNFGPTLLSWMEKFDPETYQGILEADRISQKRFSGHGSALAQAYNHMIMPLANERDRRIQVLWGIRDFEYRFKRRPEGMWLPETAVDLATLEVLAEQGIRFTILAPRQAKRVRKLGEKAWQAVHEWTLNPQMPYVCRLPSGKEITIFFYDGPISQDIAFGGLLRNGEAFANRLIEAFPKAHEEPRLVHVATDGETYGHHHRFGNMALSYCLHFIEANRLADLTIYAEYLDDHHPTQEVEIFENSSWSCVHGVERWRNNCGCHIGYKPEWQQKWRKPLREAFDWLRDATVPLCENELARFFASPWQARDEYIDVILDHSSGNVDQFLRKHSGRDLSPEEKIRVLKLLEIQRHAMYMYTSCGWFFDDISGIESTQVIQYAARVIQLAKDILGVDLEEPLLQKLRIAPSNVADVGDGEAVYQKYVRPSVIDHLDVGAHYAIVSLFEDLGRSEKIYSFDIHCEDYQRFEVGKQKLVIGRAKVRSEISWEEKSIEFAVLYLGNYNFSGGARYNGDEQAFAAMRDEMKDLFLKNRIPDAIGLMNRLFGRHHYTLWSLFKNEQRKVLTSIFNSTLESVDFQFRQIYDHFHPLMQINQDIRFPLPKALAMIVEFTLNGDLIAVLDQEPVDLQKLEELVREIKRWAFSRDKDALSLSASKKITALVERVAKDPEDASAMESLQSVLRVLNTLALPLYLWKAQNIYYEMGKGVYRVKRKQADDASAAAKVWLERFEDIGRYLKVKVPVHA